VLGSLDPSGSKVIKFYVTDVKPHFPYHVPFQIHVGYSNYTIKYTIVDEGITTCVMSLVCWKSLVSPTLSQSPTMLTYFDGRSFHPHGILPAFPVQLGGKTIEVDFEVVNTALDYNLLLGCNWTYTLTAIVSFDFHTLCFLHNMKIVMINQFFFVYTIPSASVGTSIPMVNDFQLENENIGFKMSSSLMGTFEFMASIYHIYAMSSRLVSSDRFVPFCNSYFNDP
jgi:hypothetical protein